MMVSILTIFTLSKLDKILTNWSYFTYNRTLVELKNKNEFCLAK